jgi:hypothetical protein
VHFGLSASGTRRQLELLAGADAGTSSTDASGDGSGSGERVEEASGEGGATGEAAAALPNSTFLTPFIVGYLSDYLDFVSEGQFSVHMQSTTIEVQVDGSCDDIQPVLSPLVPDFVAAISGRVGLSYDLTQPLTCRSSTPSPVNTSAYEATSNATSSLSQNADRLQALFVNNGGASRLARTLGGGAIVREATAPGVATQTITTTRSVEGFVTVECPPGFWGADGRCVPCAPGSFGLGRITECTLCSGGSYQPERNATSCLSCAAGSACKPGASTTEPCPGGTFSSRTDLASTAQCTTCPAGASCPAGSTRPTICGPGSFQGEEGQTACHGCTPGTFQSGSGSTGCQQCQSRTYSSTSSAAVCNNCLSRLSSFPGSDSCDVCDVGYFRLNASTAAAPETCRPCLENGDCPIDTTLATVHVHPKHWRLSNYSTIITSCEGNAERCTGGSDAGADGEGYCGGNYTGPTYAADLHEPHLHVVARTSSLSLLKHGWLSMRPTPLGLQVQTLPRGRPPPERGYWRVPAMSPLWIQGCCSKWGGRGSFSPSRRMLCPLHSSRRRPLHRYPESAPHPRASHLLREEHWLRAQAENPLLFLRCCHGELRLTEAHSAFKCSR